MRLLNAYFIMKEKNHNTEAVIILIAAFLVTAYLQNI